MFRRLCRRTLARRAGPFGLAVAAFLLPLLMPFYPVALSADELPPEYGEYVIDVVELDNGDVILGVAFPSPPPDPESLPATPVVERTSAAAVLLDDVPTFNWCYGCSATSAAMLFGYYDRHGFSDMYDGPANGGVCPLTNATWGYGESPLSATHQGYDGLSTRGHVDDYYVTPDSTSDPYYGNWTEHGYEDCTADFMGTNQYYNWNNADGSTTFYYYTTNAPLYDYSGSESGSPPRRDGMHGMRLFAESRGYSVATNFNQRIYGYGGISAGFTYDQYKAEIDAGRPVLIQVTGHTMLGVGYDDSSSTIYVHDTWDHYTHSMAWGGSYAGRTHYAVGVFELEQALSAPDARTDAASSVEETTAMLNGTVLDDGGEDCQYRFRYGTSAGSYGVSTSWTGAVGTADTFSTPVTGLSKGATYYFVAELRNSEGTATGSEQHFTTKPDPPSGFSAATAGPYSIDLSWTAGAGAGSTRVQRAAGSYPTGPDDGTTVYDGSGTSTTDTGLDPDTTYCYRAWSGAVGGQWSDGYAEDTATTDGLLPVVSTQDASGITASGAVLHGALSNDRGEACEYRFEYDADSGAPYAQSTEWTGAIVTGDPFEEALSGLEPGTEFFFRAQARNSAGVGSGGEMSFTTLPGPPSDFVATASGEDAVRLSWTLGEGSSDTCIVRKMGSYPADRNDGTQVYFDGGTLFVDTGLAEGTTYYYRAWAYDYGAGQWSEGWVEAGATTTSEGTPSIGVSPDSFEVLLPPGVTRDYGLTISNSGDGPLSFTVADSVAPAAPGASVAGNGGELDETLQASASSSGPVDASGVGQIIIKLKDDVRTSAGSLHRSLGASAAGGNGSGRFEVVGVPEDRDAADLIQDYLASGMVEYAEPNYPRRAAWAPDDPIYPWQWHLDAVNAEGAWDMQPGGTSDVIVAVLDTGVAYETYDAFSLAPDLAGTQFVPGWDFVNGDAHPNDDNGHGTHVCGTVAQTTDNGSGVAGLAFGVSVMPVKVLDENGSGTVATLAGGIYYAVDHGAHVVNLSLSGSGTSQTEADAIAYAYAHGVTVVCAAGNEYASGNPTQYPAAYDSTIAVGAVRYDQTRSWYSSTGAYLDIVAPGGDTSVDQNGDGYPDGVLQQTFSGSYANFVYGYYQGTSMACPHVSATAALLLSENRSLTPDAVRDALESTAVDLGTAGWDEAYGHGLLDAASALSAVAGAPWLDESPKQGSVAPSGSSPVTVTVDTSGLEDGDYSAVIVVSGNDPSTPTVETPFLLHVRTVTVPAVVTGAATGVEEQTATLHGTVQDYGWEECEYSFQYGNEESGPYQETAWSGNLESGEAFSEALSSLDRGTTWFFKARARNSAGIGYGDEMSFTTKPEAPSVLTATPDEHIPFYRVNLSWTRGDGASWTHVRVKQGAYPADPTDGDLVYDGDGASCSHSGLAPSTTYYYRAWSRVQDAGGGDVWSDAFADATASTAAEPPTVEFSLTLQPGWNMVSVPLLLPDMTIATVFAGADAVYEWDSSTKSYVQPQELDPASGYWVAVTSVLTRDYAGVPVSGWSLALEPGWRLAGSVYGGAVDFSAPDDEPDGSVEAFAYSWNALSRSYDYSQSLEPGRGHWIAATASGTLTVEYAG